MCPDIVLDLSKAPIGLPTVHLGLPHWLEYMKACLAFESLAWMSVKDQIS